MDQFRKRILFGIELKKGQILFHGWAAYSRATANGATYRAVGLTANRPDRVHQSRSYRFLSSFKNLRIACKQRFFNDLPFGRC